MVDYIGIFEHCGICGEPRSICGGDCAIVCACGHHSHLHASDPSGSGNTPCWDSLDGRTDSHGYPTNPCPCREYQPETKWVCDACKTQNREWETQCLGCGETKLTAH